MSIIRVVEGLSAFAKFVGKIRSNCGHLTNLIVYIHLTQKSFKYFEDTIENKSLKSWNITISK